MAYGINRRKPLPMGMTRPDPPDPSAALLASIRRRTRESRRRLQAVDFFLKGSIVERHMVCGNRGCACRRDPSARHGPYYQWTRKLRGKTESVWIPVPLLELCREWVENGERVVEAVTGWELVSVEALKGLRE